MSNPPENFDLECSTVRSFPRRWNRATHNSKYRGNWSPEVVRNIILRYSQEWDYLLDPMIGWWTTAIEAKLLNRNLMACDINPESLKLAQSMMDFDSPHNPKIQFKLNDTRDLSFLKDDSIDFVLTHPPYADIIKYSEEKINGDMSHIHDIDNFCDEMQKAAKEYYRVLKPWKFCAILIGDTRRKKMYQPMAFKIMQKFIDVWFELKEDIVKVQHNCKATWFRVKKSKESNFLLIMHEHLFVFQKIINL